MWQIISGFLNPNIWGLIGIWGEPPGCVSGQGICSWPLWQSLELSTRDFWVVVPTEEKLEAVLLLGSEGDERHLNPSLGDSVKEVTWLGL